MDTTSISSIFLTAILIALTSLVCRRLSQAIVESGVAIAKNHQQLRLDMPATLENREVMVIDVKIPLAGGISRLSEHRKRVLNDTDRRRGNVLEKSGRAGPEKKLIITLRMAELIQTLHLSGTVHGDVFPGVFSVKEGYVSLFDAELYAAIQEGLQFVHMGLSHNYKARAELKKEDMYIPDEAMDVHCWAKTVLAIYNGAHPTMSFSENPPRPMQPQAMPDALWNILQECLSEDLIGLPTMDDIVTNMQTFV